MLMLPPLATLLDRRKPPPVAFEDSVNGADAHVALPGRTRDRRN
jgi:hypothetical protein